MTNYEKIHRLMYMSYTSPVLINSLFSFFELQENNNIDKFHIYCNSNINIISILDFFKEKYILQYNSQFINNTNIKIVYNELFNEIIRFCFGYYDEVDNKNIQVWEYCYHSFINDLKRQIILQDNQLSNLFIIHDFTNDNLFPQQKYLLYNDTIIHYTYNWKLLLYLIQYNKYFISTCLDNMQLNNNIDLHIKSITRSFNKYINNYQLNQSYFSILFYFSNYLNNKYTLTQLLATLKKLYQSQLSSNIIMQMLISLMFYDDKINNIYNSNEWKKLYDKKLRISDNIREMLLSNLNLSFSQIYNDEF